MAATISITQQQTMIEFHEEMKAYHPVNAFQRHQTPKRNYRPTPVQITNGLFIGGVSIAFRSINGRISGLNKMLKGEGRDANPVVESH
ncbi:hypothetical protein DKX38_001289 [Salix brachista]|uniref:Uncharacterized protein n=1 Tax=Salix brachista TaxID=2182728 RepID=A0A5N5P2Z2_9ROSI|nr:hypothetical protein DKX38_001289 [Salix brachista]